ncbi:DUF3761 domain-containing protein [Nocardia spumae]|uniref:DUF3761 domain-containing protein n=1 Tax=Nocardia spumae TaxID=2887190 RepID=UPI001D1377FC|nr:DUF3761 domain-containing protein [Nocardia spumae]
MNSAASRARRSRTGYPSRRTTLTGWLLAAGVGVAAVLAPAATVEAAPAFVSCPAGDYENVDHACVPRPGQDPDGATAQCRDGSYSYSRNHRGTCSHHGGVDHWL